MSYGQAGDVADRLDFLVAQNETSRGKIKSGVFSFEESFGSNLPADLAKAELKNRSGSMMFQDDYRLGTKKEMVGIGRSLDGPVESHIATEMRSVVGPSHAGVWIVGQPVAEQHDHEAPKSMRTSTKGIVEQHAGQDFLQLGFGLPIKPLRELIKQNPDRSSWQVDERDSPAGRVFVLKRFLNSPSGDPKLTLEVELNAKKGFLVTAARFYTMEGQQYSAIDLNVEDVTGRGDWVVTRYEDKTFKDPSNPSQSPLTLYRAIKLQYKDINQPVEKSVFDIKSLGLPEKLTVAHEGIDGRQDVYIVSNAQPLPQQLALAIHAASAEMNSHLDSLAKEPVPPR
jgi:hypothetical protein